MLAIGIDPGTAITGYGLIRQAAGGAVVVVDYGVIRTSANDQLALRLVQLQRELAALIEIHHPEIGAVEKLFFQRNVSTAMSVGQARGVALLCLASAGVRVGEYTPLEIKQAVVGYGKASKGQVQRMVQRTLAMDQLPKPDDAADALAVAMCHLQTWRTLQRIEDQRS